MIFENLTAELMRVFVTKQRSSEIRKNILCWKY